MTQTAVQQRAAPPAPLTSLWVAQGGRRVLGLVLVPLLVVAAVAWTVTARADDMTMAGAGSFVAAWLVMMVAMMLPAVAPVAGVYVMAARRGVVAAVPVFVAGYLCVWALSAVPAYLISQQVYEPLMNGEPWVARLTGGTLLVAAAYQLTPFKAACLRNCRSPMSFFLARRKSLSRPTAAYAAGLQHGLYCLGCCWALMAVLIVLGGMQLGWALGLAVLISSEKLLPHGTAVLRVIAIGLALLGAALLVDPSLLPHLIRM